MPNAPRKIQQLVTSTLRREAANRGRTTLNNIVTMVYSQIERRGGYQAFGIGRADIVMAVRSIIAREAKSQLIKTLPEDSFRAVLNNGAPPELRAILPRLPQWIAIEKGSDAQWVPSLQATYQEWLANAEMKNILANQTIRRADFSVNVADYLKQYGLTSLSEVLD